MTLRGAGFAVAIAAVVAIGAVHAACELTLSTRKHVEDWQAKRAYRREPLSARSVR